MLDMGIIKVEVNFPELKDAVASLEHGRKRFFELLSQELRNVASNAINQVLSSEMTVFLGKSSEKDNKRNGYHTREYALKGLGGVTLRMPLDRHRRFESAVIPKGERLDPRLKEDMAVLHLAGISTRDLEMMSKRLLGVEVSRQTVSNSLGEIQEKAVDWLTRPLTGRYWALYVDGTNFKIQRRGSTEKEPSLVVLGIDEFNRKSILAIEPGTKDNVDAWTAVFEGVDACVSPVLSLGEAVHHPHNRARGTYIARAGHLQPAPAPRFSATQGEAREPAATTLEAAAARWG